MIRKEQRPCRDVLQWLGLGSLWVSKLCRHGRNLTQTERAQTVRQCNLSTRGGLNEDFMKAVLKYEEGKEVKQE